MTLWLYTIALRPCTEHNDPVHGEQGAFPFAKLVADVEQQVWALGVLHGAGR